MRRLMLVPLLILLAVQTRPVFAANAVVGSGSPASCTESALQAAVATVNNGGGTITFNCGGAHTINLGQQLRFTTQGATYVIDGGGLITLNGQNQTRLIYTLSGRSLSLTVKDIRLVNGYATGEPSGERARNQGGAIYSGYNNALVVQGVTFDGNRAQAQYHEYHGGGAIAIDTTSVVRISDSVFINNSAPNGGAINNLLSRLTIERSVFRDNEATRPDPGGGGAIYNDAGKLTIKDSHIFDNTSANLGGGIFSWAHDVNGSYSGKTTIKNTVIDGNHAEAGGGLWKGGAYVLTLNNSSVTNNTADRVGGGLSGTGPGKNFKIVNSTIAYNAVLTTGSAGGLFSANNGSTVKNSTFAYNTVLNDAASVGGAVHGTVTFTNTIFLGNTGGWNGIRGCFGSITNGGRNIQSPGDSCGAGIPVKDALLSATLQPARNALTPGKTQTLVPQAGSPAINKAAGCPKKDQRGIKRPQGAKCDIGAVEVEGTKPPKPLISFPLPDATGVPLQPVFTWGGANTVDFKVTIAKANGTAVQKVTMAGCLSSCAYHFASSGKTLKAGKKYTLTVQARNDFGKSKSKVTFRTATNERG